MNAQAIQDKIYRKMSARRKLEIMASFHQTGKFLNSLNNDKKTIVSRNRNSNKSRQSS
ncbi:MAG: hypothetical protein HW405_242 [Candidatus Berkelbacteria bacterium]|nr:hypothetical protein [Candidatus Berkelbacteria bacterium]